MTKFREFTEIKRREAVGHVFIDCGAVYAVRPAATWTAESGEDRDCAELVVSGGPSIRVDGSAEDVACAVELTAERDPVAQLESLLKGLPSADWLPPSGVIPGGEC